MALASTMVWEVRVSGDPANSGGFNSAAAGTDRSQQDAPHVILDGVTITAVVQATTTDLLITGYVVSAADVGNTVRIAGGTMTAGTYEITAIPAAQTWRLDRSGGTAAQTGEGRMGGASSDPALVAAVTVGANTIYLRSGTYLITSTTANVAGGRISTPAGSQHWEGYQTTRGDLGTAPLLQASGIAGVTLLTLAANDVIVHNISVDGAGLGTIRGMDIIGRGTINRCEARRCTDSGLVGSGSGFAILSSRATLCSGTAALLDNAGGSPGMIVQCEADANTTHGIQVNQATVQNCLVINNSGAGSDGVRSLGSGGLVMGTTAYGNGQDGFNPAAASNGYRAINCLAEANGRYGFNLAGIQAPQLYRCGAFNNTTANINGTPTENIDFVTATTTFFTNAAGGDFSLNDTPTGGGLVRGSVAPVSFLDGLTTSYLDRGAAQALDGGAGGGGGGIGPVVGAVWGGGL